MRKYLTLQMAVALFFTLGALVALRGYWYTQQQKLSELHQQIEKLPEGKDKVSLVKDRIALENTINGSLIQAAGGFLLLSTAYVSFQTLLVAQEKQITERFTQAINQLGSKQIEVRIGGVYALERIAKDSPKDHWTIMEVLTSFVQERSSQGPVDKAMKHLLPDVAKDVQAALTAIGRRKAGQDPKDENLLLNGRNLCGAYLGRAKLSRAILSRANLSRADFSASNLSRADFSVSSLVRANLSEANLIGANLREVDLYEANLSKADLSRANLSEANLFIANLRQADLRQADFRNAKGLDPEQVKAAKNWKEADYDEDFRQKLGLPSKEKL